MSFFDNIFGGKDSSEKNRLWKYIESEEDLHKAIEDSFIRKIAIFKHSTSCFISKTVLKNFEKEIESSDQKPELYFLDLLAHRAISNKIATDLEVRHESPQLLVIENGKVISSASHQHISADQIV
ncbi:bacillithiol system redox-active protein YtxJ [Chryseobacterium salviniae]|uniref:Bacillithiol system redox-active protein YtxJ n=1 Tax=Chryseobacterium salviniae TaxID=3101750 RepID=A0ABU6HTH3_9FLAO|nr:bacillithiol system redox-active protein YtxJ [Chryseobacterium sp. T9W2-O]MEC3876349.1 bacillithiol system redox-active protein YtxJ [Chryseobacterium sp. T9W2-O]